MDIKEYVQPQFNVVITSAQDIITASGEETINSLSTAFTDWETRTRTSFWSI